MLIYVFAGICFIGILLCVSSFFAEQSDREGGKEYTIAAVAGIVLAILGVVLMTADVEYNSSHPIVSNYDLQEIEPGIYAYTSTVVSNIPAENYEMCTVLINGQYITIKGTVKIMKSDGSVPKIKWENRRIVNGDTATIYADINQIKNNGVRAIS